MSELEYLRDIGVKALQYDEVRSHVIGFLIEKQIRNEEIATDLFIMAFLWLAHRREETLTDRDILMLLDNESDVTTLPFEELNVYKLDEDNTHYSLDELLDKIYSERV